MIFQMASKAELQETVREVDHMLSNIDGWANFHLPFKIRKKRILVFEIFLP